MSTATTYDVSWLKKDDGETRGNWIKVGIAFTDGDNGRLTVKVDAVPLNWDGKLTLFPHAKKV